MPIQKSRKLHEKMSFDVGFKRQARTGKLEKQGKGILA